jgi:hypothetical protein
MIFEGEMWITIFDQHEQEMVRFKINRLEIKTEHDDLRDQYGRPVGKRIKSQQIIAQCA